MQVGQWSIAVGRTFEQDEPNVSVGVVSATNRIWGKAVQTDAKVSPTNYGGPLVDIRGRVLGVLVPLSPQGGSEIAGAEWYDSGIGFAVPLAEMGEAIEKLKQGQDLYPGILGVTLKPGDMYVDPAEVAAAPASSPAAKSGIQPGDVIVEIDSVAVASQVQLRHQLGHRYAGEVLHVAVRRGEERIELDVELVDELAPYQHPFLGILPMRAAADGEPGVVVRHVYTGSPADKAGVAAGDRVTAIDARETADARSLLEAMAAYEVGGTATLDVSRGSEKLQFEVTFAALPVDIPASLPPAHVKPAADDDARPAVGWIEVKLPEESNDCYAYVPETYHGEVPCGLVVWLAPPGEFDKDALLARWKDLCDSADLILLVPRPADATRWLPTEVGFVRKTIDNVLTNYHVDPTRVVIHGHRAGGAMAYLVALAHRDVTRGVAVVDAPIPARAQPPENDAVERLAVYSAASAKSRLAEEIAATIKVLTDRKFPVTVRDLGDEPRYLSAAELDELVRWIDTLDRI
jgi:serine protease Do